MAFKPYTLYKHENGKDAAIFVLEQMPVENGIELKVLWYNVHYNEVGATPPFQVSEKMDKIFIHKDRLNQWQEYIPEEHFGKI